MLSTFKACEFDPSSAQLLFYLGGLHMSVVEAGPICGSRLHTSPTIYDMWDPHSGGRGELGVGGPTWQLGVGGSYVAVVWGRDLRVDGVEAGPTWRWVWGVGCGWSWVWERFLHGRGVGS